MLLILEINNLALLSIAYYVAVDSKCVHYWIIPVIPLVFEILELGIVVLILQFREHIVHPTVYILQCLEVCHVVEE